MPPLLIGVAVGIVGTLAAETAAIITVLCLLGRPTRPKRRVRT